MPSSRIPINPDWCTPPAILLAAKRALAGKIGLDPCSHKYSVVAAQREWALPYKDGLAEEWTQSTVFVHPPFPRDRENGTSINDWIAKCADSRRRHGGEIIALLPATPNAESWLRHVWPEARGLCFLFAKRILFIEGGREDGKGFRIACCVVFWGDSFERFEKEFCGLGAVVDLASTRMPGRPPNDALRWLLCFGLQK